MKTETIELTEEMEMPKRNNTVAMVLGGLLALGTLYAAQEGVRYTEAKWSEYISAAIESRIGQNPSTKLMSEKELRRYVAVLEARSQRAEQLRVEVAGMLGIEAEFQCNEMRGKR